MKFKIYSIVITEEFDEILKRNNSSVIVIMPKDYLFNDHEVYQLKELRCESVPSCYVLFDFDDLALRDQFRVVDYDIQTLEYEYYLEVNDGTFDLHIATSKITGKVHYLLVFDDRSKPKYTLHKIKLD
jgi:hypothetical protein